MTNLPTPPVGSVAEVTAAYNMLRRFDRQLQAAPHDMAVWIVRCLAVQFAEKPQADIENTDVW